jgi:hypothetical protein
MLTDGERERGKGKEENYLCERVRSLQDPYSVPLISRKSQLQVLLTWFALKALSGHLLVNNWQGTLTSYQSPNSQSLTPVHESSLMGY